MSYKNDKNSNRSSYDASDSYGLEPPKIYRETNDSDIKRNTRSGSKGKKGKTNYRSSTSSDRTAKKISYEQSSQNRNISHGKSKAELRRRQDKKRRLKKWVRQLIAAVIIIFAVIVIIAILSLTVFFKVDKINISGSGIYSSEEIIGASGIKDEDSLLLVDKEDAAELIETMLPYIYSAEVKISLPSEVKIKVTDAAVAYDIKNKDGTYILMDDNFKVLEKDSEKKASGAITIKVNDKSTARAGYQIEFKKEDTLNNLQLLAEAIKATSFTEATKIKTNGEYENYIVYDSRITFKLGTCDDLENKIYRGLAACEKLDESNPGVSGTLDLTLDKQVYFSED